MVPTGFTLLPNLLSERDISPPANSPACALLCLQYPHTRAANAYGYHHRTLPVGAMPPKVDIVPANAHLVGLWLQLFAGGKLSSSLASHLFALSSNGFAHARKPLSLLTRAVALQAHTSCTFPNASSSSARRSATACPSGCPSSVC